MSGADESRGRASRRKGGLSTIQDALGLVVERHQLHKTRSDADVLAAWRRAVGTDLARRARAVRFRGGELLVEVHSSAHLHDLTHFSGERYRLRANHELGVERIQRVAFKMKS